jgi:2-amino-4-hydroxy-6-hydroxymethyldihydropteridine diphosphokinase
VAESVFVALGSNLGDRAAYLASARNMLSLLPQTALVAATRVEETVPFGPVAQGPYLNQMVALDTTLPPTVLLDACQAIERRLGRVRAKRWGPRTIDLDVVRYGSLALATPSLTLPHPGIPDRDFWQREIAELTTLLASAA